MGSENRAFVFVIKLLYTASILETYFLCQSMIFCQPSCCYRVIYSSESAQVLFQVLCVHFNFFSILEVVPAFTYQQWHVFELPWGDSPHVLSFHLVPPWQTGPYAVATCSVSPFKVSWGAGSVEMFSLSVPKHSKTHIPGSKTSDIRL